MDTRKSTSSDDAPLGPGHRNTRVKKNSDRMSSKKRVLSDSSDDEVPSVKRQLKDERLCQATIKCHSHFNVFCAAFAGYIIVADVVTKSLFPSHMVESSYPQFGKNMIRVFSKGFQSLVRAIEHAIRYYTQNDEGIFQYVILNDTSTTWKSNTDHCLVLQQDDCQIVFTKFEDVLMFSEAATGCILHTCLPNLLEFELVTAFLTSMEKNEKLPTQFPEDLWTDTKEQFLSKEPWGLQNRHSLEVRIRQFWRTNFYLLDSMHFLNRLVAIAKGTSTEPLPASKS